MTYNGMVVARPLNKPESMLFASPDECAIKLNLIIPKDGTFGELLDAGRSRFTGWGTHYTYKIRKVEDCRAVFGDLQKEIEELKDQLETYKVFIGLAKNIVRNDEIRKNVEEAHKRMKE